LRPRCSGPGKLRGCQSANTLLMKRPSLCHPIARRINTVMATEPLLSLASRRGGSDGVVSSHCLLPDMCQCLFLAGMCMVRSAMSLPSWSSPASKVSFHLYPSFSRWHFWIRLSDSEFSADTRCQNQTTVPFGHTRVRVRRLSQFWGRISLFPPGSEPDRSDQLVRLNLPINFM
jgi:hypothetical protein